MGTDEKLEKHGDLFVEDVGEPRSIGADLEHDGSPRNVPQASGAEERRYLRKLDAIILPMIALLYFFEYIDRSNIAVCVVIRSDLWLMPLERETLGPRQRTRHAQQRRRPRSKGTNRNAMADGSDDILRRPLPPPDPRFHWIPCVLAVEGRPCVD